MSLKQEKQYILDILNNIITTRFYKTPDVIYLTDLYNKVNPLYIIDYTFPRKSKYYNLFNPLNSYIEEIKIFSLQEITYITEIIKYLCKYDIFSIILFDFKQNYNLIELFKFYNLYRYNTSKEILYNLRCIFKITVNDKIFFKCYDISFIIYKIKNIQKYDLEDILKINYVIELGYIEQLNKTVI